ncbi:hypothetical protein HaLaN_30124, partial [Haematococcus lacustris]
MAVLLGLKDGSAGEVQLLQ